MKYIAFSLILILTGLYLGQTAIQSSFLKESDMGVNALANGEIAHMCNDTCNDFYTDHAIDFYCRTGHGCSIPFASCCTLHNRNCGTRMIPIGELNFPSRCPNGVTSETSHDPTSESY
ncbi:unnamed protein product [Moneuplotes crassus]|uniref:Uncharacterized protein n=1 Tax=Euplotes crassus TaxID=5936 RepID=A0AAD1XXU8_EUPCR|nr:unnamed protein product [Moneuplotes crassus]